MSNKIKKQNRSKSDTTERKNNLITIMVLKFSVKHDAKITIKIIKNMNAKERLLIYLKHLGVGQNAFEKNVGISNGYISNNKGSLGTPILKKIADSCDDLNMEWLALGKGNMLNTTTKNEINVSGGKVVGFANVVSGGNNTFNADEGKDRLIETQERQVINMFTALIEELKGFHEVGARRDDRIKDQDTYIASIVKSSYLRNESNMIRIDELIRQQNEDRKDMREIIRIIDRQNQKVQERADRLLDLLEKILNTK